MHAPVAPPKPRTVAAVSTWLDVTDLVEFLQRRESVSGVQRVIAETAPLLLDRDADAQAVVLDRGRGVFVPMTGQETQALVRTGVSSFNADPDREAIATAAHDCLERARAAAPLAVDDSTVLVFLGAVWISDALMLAARDAHARGARCVYLLYDLTPVLETGHTAAVNRLFERYLRLVTQTGSAVPAISQSSRTDYERYARARGWSAPPGRVTGLPCGLTPAQHGLSGQDEVSESPWPRPYALFVGTVEARKSHLLALRAWQRLIERHGAQNVPDLVCIGRLGWNADAFLDEYVATAGLDGKLSVLSTSVPDAELARFYAHARFTVYPSSYEGWGLPVSESLAFGKVAVVAHNSSLPEAGGELASYFESGSIDDLVRVIERDGLDEQARTALEARIGIVFEDLTWQQVADTIAADIDLARTQEGRPPVYPAVELGREYVLSLGEPAPDAGYADQYFAHLQAQGLTPMLQQSRRDDAAVVDAAIVGPVGSPQTWGYELRPGRKVDIRLTRPTGGPLVVLLATRAMPGIVRVEATGPGGPVSEEVYLGSVLTLPLGDGAAGESAQVSLAVTDVADSLEGFMGIRSFVVLAADDLTTQVVAHKAMAAALRQELDFLQGTRSWKITAPLRRFKGRGAGH